MGRKTPGRKSLIKWLYPLIEERTNKFDLRAPPKSYDQRIAALEVALATGVYHTREPFKYFLPIIVWDDMRFPIGSVRGGGAFDTTPTAYKNDARVAKTAGRYHTNNTT